MWALFFVCGVLLTALTVYVLTGGADYGGGAWDLIATGARAGRQRELIAKSMGPIWEADHVWLILIVVILFSGFPSVFATIMTSLHVPVALMLVGIVLRGSAFSFRTYGVDGSRNQSNWGRVFGIASLITPLLLGVIFGAIASGRVPEDPRVVGDFVLPWLTPFCISVGVFALALFAYLAAVYATLETEDSELQNDFRIRSIAAGVAVGLMAAVVLLLSINGAPRIWRGLTGRPWTWPLIWATSALGIIALHSLWTRRYQLARFCALGEVTLILWGWAFAQFPYLVEPSLSIYNASAPPITLRLMALALAAGSVLLLPSYQQTRIQPLPSYSPSDSEVSQRRGS
jgi:cytochrome bd ubiquinol oxidase subunit II